MSFSTCKFFRSEQGCKFGNKCRYKHSESFSPHLNPEFDQHNQNEGSVSTRFQASETSALAHHRRPAASRENAVSVRSPEVGCFDSTISSDSPVTSSKNEGLVNASASETRLQENFQQLQASDHDGKAVSAGYRPTAQQRSTQKLCHYFSRNGNCCFGSRCRFEHVQPYRAPPRFQQNRSDFNASSYGIKADTRDQSSRHQDGKTEEKKGVRDPVFEDRKYDSYLADSPAQLRSVASGVPERHAAVAGDQSADFPHGQAQGQGGIHNDNTPLGLQIKSDKVCQFNLTGRCWRGKRCKFMHPGYQAGSAQKQSVAGADRYGNSQRDCKEQDRSSQKEAQKSEESLAAGPGNHKEKEARAPSARQAKTPYVAQGIKKYRRDEVDDVEGSRLRRMEIDQLVKRFPKSKIKVNRDCAEYFECVISFSPTDPDWPFDVKVFQLQVDIPADYPFEMLTICLPAEQDLPETVRRYLEVSVEEWLEEKERQLEDKGQLELVFRSFHRWLDRSIEETVTEGLRQLKRELVAKAAGLEFISAKQLQKQYRGQASDDSDNADGEENDEDDETESGSEEEEDTSSDYDDSGEEESGDEEQDVEEEEEKRNSKQKSHLDKVKAMLVEPGRKGTEVSMKNLQLKESASTVYFEKLCLTIQCERCKGTSEFNASAGRTNVVQCGQCGQTQMAIFRPAMAHHYSAVIGYLDLDACLPFDVILQNCNAIISCLHCSKETKPGAVLPGQPQDHWCRVCHHKLRICTDGIRFTRLEPSGPVQSLKGSVKVVVPTRKRIPKDPAIQEGKPLPNFGTCKHYKKSYRWLRFPCCGKCYPCDICHESKEDHEMKFANRMICGFCCKEQMYAPDRPCKGCDMNMTKVHTKHWEGGQGCRDKITMCRNDKQKHRNMAKTVSKHSQKVKDMQSKKKTKLRHT